MTRVTPAITDTNRAYWTGGAAGELRIQRCQACERYQHPPEGRCTACGGAVEPVAVSGRGTVYTFTVNTQPFNPEVEVPYVVALVELAEQEDLTVPTNLVGIDPADVRIGQPVQVRFEEHGEVWVPLFEPVVAP